jgi:hypothetical protein
MFLTHACAIIFLSVAAAESGSDGAESARELARFHESKWIVTRSLKEIDVDVLHALKARFGVDDRLADHGEPFEESDVLSRKPPRRLLLAGRSGRRWFVAYEVGGRGHHVVLAVLAATPPPGVVLLARGQAGAHDDASDWEVDLEELRAALKARELYLEDRREPYY